MEASGTILRGNFSGAAQWAGAPAPHEPSHEHETEWCERRLLARIHRLTVATLRKQIEPVTAAQFMQWLLRWQHAAVGTQVAGERGTLEVLRQLQGFEIPANAWERQVLARRIVDYDPKWLDQLCLTGAVGWGRLSPHPATLDSNAGRGSEAGAASRQRRVIPTSVAPITFFVREDADWMTPRHPGAEQAVNSGLSHVAQMVLDFLRQRGASFFADIVRGTEKLKAEIETALWELVAAGLVTADGFDNLRSLIDPKRRAGQGSGRTTRPRHNAGRWALLHTEDVVERPRAVEAACWMLLRRYGIVARDVLAREANLPPWRELLAGFRRLEDRGEIRGGRFVDGFIGEQFALPVAVESVRAMRKLDPTQGTITLSAADPLNLVGIRFRANGCRQFPGTALRIATERRLRYPPLLRQAMKLSPVEIRPAFTKNQGSDEGALRIPGLAPSRQGILQKRFPHRFLPSASAALGMHAVCQFRPPWQRLSASRQRAVDKALNA